MLREARQASSAAPAWQHGSASSRHVQGLQYHTASCCWLSACGHIRQVQQEHQLASISKCTKVNRQEILAECDQLAMQAPPAPRPPERAQDQHDWQLLEQLRQSNTTQTGTIKEANKGGLIVLLDVGGKVGCLISLGDHAFNAARPLLAAAGHGCCIPSGQPLLCEQNVSSWCIVAEHARAPDAKQRTAFSAHAGLHAPRHTQCC